MKIILDDTNPSDAKLMQILGAVMTQQAQQARKPVPERDADGDVVAGTKPAVAAVPDEEPQEAEDPEVTEEVDADGVEWNPELHASTKTKTADGRWKKRRGSAKQAEEKTSEAAPKTETAAAGGYEVFKEAIIAHKGKHGVDRTREILIKVTGVQTPSEVKADDYDAVAEALNSDKGAASDNIDLDDFC